jgi:hypothetical protein
MNPSEIFLILWAIGATVIACAKHRNMWKARSHVVKLLENRELYEAVAAEYHKGRPHEG